MKITDKVLKMMDESLNKLQEPLVKIALSKLKKYDSRTPDELKHLSKEEEDEILWCFKVYYTTKEWAERK